MAVVHTATRNLKSTIVNTKLLLVGLLFALAIFFSSIISVQAAPYGSCNYAEGDFNTGGTCETPTIPSEDLSETGQNWKYLAFAAAGLILTAASITTILLVLKKRHTKTA